MPELAIASFLVTLAVGVPVGLFAYSRLLARLREHHPEQYRALGSPRLFGHSPRQSWALQRLLYTRGWSHDGDEQLRRTCRFLAFFTPALVLGVFAEILWFLVQVAEELP